MDYTPLLEIYREKFSSSPRGFRSPGRINIIGEHTDYNDGFVLPAATDKEIGMIMGLNNTNTCFVYSFDTGEEVSFSLDAYDQVDVEWAKYIIGVIDQLFKEGHIISGVDVVFGGDIPIGAGMSSSAALECAALYGLDQLFDLNLDKRSIATLAQKAENEFVGVNCGIMDQFASVFSEESQAIKLDCRDLSYEMYDLDLKGYQLLLVDSMVKHSLASSEYNVRRAECEKGVAVLQNKYPSVQSLRDVSVTQLDSIKDEVSATVYKRCKYVIEEISRVTEATHALQNHNLQELGELLYETHNGLQHEYEVSCDEVDFLVDFTRSYDSVLGARMMGGGFGGCSLNLVEVGEVEEFTKQIQAAYNQKYGKEPPVYLVSVVSGTSEVKLEI